MNTRAYNIALPTVILALAGAASLTYRYDWTIGMAYMCTMFIMAPYFKVITYTRSV